MFASKERINGGWLLVLRETRGQKLCGNEGGNTIAECSLYHLESKIEDNLLL